MTSASPGPARPMRSLIVDAPVDTFFGYYPGTVSVVTSELEGDRNVMSAGWHAPLSATPPLYGVALGRDRYSYRLVTGSGAFGVHFLPFRHSRIFAAVGSTSRRNGVDKFERFSLATRRGAVLPLPVLVDAYLAYECRVVDVHRTGDHDWVVGEVVAVHYDPAAFDDARLQDGAAVPAAVYYGRGEYEELGGGRRAKYSPATFTRRT